MFELPFLWSIFFSFHFQFVKNYEFSHHLFVVVVIFVFFLFNQLQKVKTKIINETLFHPVSLQPGHSFISREVFLFFSILNSVYSIQCLNVRSVDCSYYEFEFEIFRCNYLFHQFVFNKKFLSF